MKKLKLNLQEIEGVRMLTRDQLKKVLGGGDTTTTIPYGGCGQTASCNSPSDCKDGCSCYASGSCGRPGQAGPDTTTAPAP